MGDRRRTGAERTSWVHPTRPSRDCPPEEFRDATWSRAPRLSTLQVMSGRAQKVLGEALDLTDKERAEVALELVASLDGPRVLLRFLREQLVRPHAEARSGFDRHKVFGALRGDRGPRSGRNPSGP